jgi:PKD repeat protein
MLFADTSTFSPDDWLWDFGDGSPVDTEQNPSHTYAVPGGYTVSFTAANSAGSDSTDVVLTVVAKPVRQSNGRRVQPNQP